MRKVDWKDVGKRAVKTFIQAFVAAVGVHAEQIAEIRDFESAKAIAVPIVVGGVAAGISAVWNVMTGYFRKKKVRLSDYDKKA